MCSFDCVLCVRVTVCEVFVCNGVQSGNPMLVMRGWSLHCPTTPGSEGTLHWLLPQSISRPRIGCLSVASAQTSPAVAGWLFSRLSHRAERTAPLRGASATATPGLVPLRVRCCAPRDLHSFLSARPHGCAPAQSSASLAPQFTFSTQTQLACLFDFVRLAQLCPDAGPLALRAHSAGVAQRLRHQTVAQLSAHLVSPVARTHAFASGASSSSSAKRGQCCARNAVMCTARGLHDGVRAVLSMH